MIETLLIYVGCIATLIYLMYICLFSMREMQASARQKLYIKQGFKKFYTPLMGQLGLFAPDFVKDQDGLSRSNSLLEKADKEGYLGIVASNPWQNCAHIFLTKFELIKEFMEKEDSHTVPVSFDVLSWKSSFALNQVSIKKEKYRAVLESVFSEDTLLKDFEPIRNKICLLLKSLMKPQEFEKKVEIGGYVELIAKTALAYSLFGSEDKEILALCDKILYAQVFAHSNECQMSKFNLYLGGVPIRKSWMTSFNDHKKSLEEAREQIKELLSKRESGQNHKLAHNLVDSCIRFNKKGKSDKFTHEEIAGFVLDCCWMIFEPLAGQLSNIIFMLGAERECQTKLQEELLKSFPPQSPAERASFRDIDAENYLHGFVRETLRFRPSMFVLQERIITKEMELGKVYFEPGDRIQIPLAYLMTTTEAVPQPNLFNPTNFSGANRKSMDNQGVNVPFWVGPGKSPLEPLFMIILKTFVAIFGTTYQMKLCDVHQIAFETNNVYRPVKGLVLGLTKTTDNNIYGEGSATPAIPAPQPQNNQGKEKAE